MLDALTVFTGVFAIALAILLITVDLLLDPGLRMTDQGGTVIIFAIPPDSMIFFAAIIAMMAIITILNDVLAERMSRQVAIYGSLSLGILGALLHFAGAPAPLCLTLTALAICLFIFLWGAILSTLNSRVLIFMLMFISIFAGMVILLGTQLDSKAVFALLSLFYLISWLSMRRVSRSSLDRIVLVDRRQSIERHVRGKGNSFTLVLVGGLFGITAVLTSSIGLTLRELTSALGICLLLAGLIVAFFHRDLFSGLGDVAKRSLALVMVVGLAPFPFLDRIGQMVCICFLFVAGTINLILIIDSILETSRFNQISPFWIIGREGGTFFAGALAVPLATTLLLAFSEQGLGITILALVALSSILQIYINNQAYPLFTLPAIPSAEQHDRALEPSEVAVAPEEFGHGSALWRERIGQIAAEYRLSSRQREIMELLIRGWDLSYITTHFRISRSTAKTHISNLYRKMGIHSKQELLDMMESLRDGGTLEH
jgi:DNA-binding CsgD family transcriptional regulator